MVFAGQRVLVLGAGVSGVAAARLLLARGAVVCLVDEGLPVLGEGVLGELEAGGVELRFGARAGVGDWGGFDFGVLSPGVGRGSVLRGFLEGLGLRFVGEVELGFLGGGDGFGLVGVTGTNGKTTTVGLVECGLRGCGLGVRAAGNVGFPFSAAVLGCVGLDWLVLELSSFQLEGVSEFGCGVGVLLGLSPDHLDRYGCLEDYYLAKARLFGGQGGDDWAIVECGALRVLESLGVVFGGRVLSFGVGDGGGDVFYDGGRLVSRVVGWEGVLCEFGCGGFGGLVGLHNVGNLMAAFLVGYVLGLPLEGLRRGFGGFRPGRYRFERLGVVGGVVVVNDSKSTNVGSLEAGVLAGCGLCGEGGRLWLVAGGLCKGGSFDGVAGLLGRVVAGVFLFGAAREVMGEAWGGVVDCRLCGGLGEAVVGVFGVACAGDVVLFSPGCASFDLFRDYVERGEVFEGLVRGLGGGFEVVEKGGALVGGVV